MDEYIALLCRFPRAPERYCEAKQFILAFFGFITSLRIKCGEEMSKIRRKKLVHQQCLLCMRLLLFDTVVGIKRFKIRLPI